MTEHTPGPWEANGTSVINPRAKYAGIDGKTIAKVQGWGNETESHQLANARLIASAPQLEIALARAVIERDNPKTFNGPAWLNEACEALRQTGFPIDDDIQARAAIAKARNTEE